jgi:hypothetical protein
VMSDSIKIAPPNSLIGISDVKKGEVPNVDVETGISATETCILVGCWPEIDGETEITLGPAAEVDPGHPPAFDGRLQTPSGRLQVVTVDWRPLLTAVVVSAKTQIRIWTNRSRFPDKIVIGFE